MSSLPVPAESIADIRSNHVGPSWRSILLVIALLTSSLALSGCGRTAAGPTCTTKELVAAAGKGYLKLPPSRDNDAGRGRIRDTTLDRDLDANQRAALCKILRSETHLPG